MSLTRVNQLSEIAPLLNGFFNRPVLTPDFTEDDWENEYGSVHERVFERLQRAEAAMSGLAEEAFSMGPGFAKDRKIGVVIMYIGLLSADLLRELQGVLAESPEDYLIYLDGDDYNGEQYYITVTKQEILAYAHNPVSLLPLGFD